MLEWLEARCSNTLLQQVLWETYQRLHLLCAACLTGSAAICISQQPFHRRCYCLHPAYCSLPPGKQECLCEDAFCGLQLRIQYHSACHTGCETPESRTKQISVQLDPGLSDRQKSGGQNGQQHFISADPQHWCSAGLRSQPLLYSLYTHDCTATHSSNVIVKFADDTTVIGLITDNDETAYRAEVSTLTNWCQENHLSLNIDKTKELVVDFRRQSREHTPITIDKTPVERVNSFKFLGVHITEDLTWSTHTDAVLKKSHQCLFFLRRLRNLEWAPASSDHSTPALWRASWPAASPPGLETAPLATGKLCKGLCELPATLLEVSFPPSRTSTPGGV